MTNKLIHELGHYYFFFVDDHFKVNQLNYDDYVNLELLFFPLIEKGHSE